MILWVFVMTKFSVLLYVFNDDEFLEDSLESILNQSFSDFELLCIDDESDDNSLSILKEYSKKDNRIKIQSQKHKGFSSSINKLIASATGNYLYITKCGTLLKEETLKVIYETVNDKKLDMIIANVENYDKINDSLYENKQFSINELINQTHGNIFNFTNIGDLIFKMNPFLENILFSSDFFKENNFSLDENSNYGDVLLFFEAILSSKSIYCIKDFLFIHLDYYTSLKNRKTEKLLDIPSLSNNILKIFKKYDEFDNFKSFIYDYKFDLDFNYYEKIKETYKNDYFVKTKSSLINLVKNENEFDDFLENISDSNRKIFEQIIISENFYEYDRLRITYSDKNKYNKLLDRKRYLQPFIDAMDKN